MVYPDPPLVTGSLILGIIVILPNYSTYPVGWYVTQELICVSALSVTVLYGSVVLSGALRGICALKEACYPLTNQ